MLPELKMVNIMGWIAVVAFGTLQLPQVREISAKSTTDICSNSFEGGIGEPRFCRIQEHGRVVTPYFSVNLDPNLLVGIDSNGRRLVMQPSLWGSLIALNIRALDVTKTEDESLNGWACNSTELGNASGISCTWITDPDSGIVWRRYVLRRGGNAVEINLSASSHGQSQLPLVENIIKSIEIAF